MFDCQTIGECNFVNQIFTKQLHVFVVETMCEREREKKRRKVQCSLHVIFNY